MNNIRRKLRKLIAQQSLVISVLATSFILIWIVVLALSIYRTFYQKTNNLQQFEIIKHGDYRVIQKYLPAKKTHAGNSSVTLVLHCEYSKLAHLTMIMSRWAAPISISVLLRNQDFERVRRLLVYMMKCTDQGLNLRSLTTFTFVVHKKYFPRYWPANDIEFFHNDVDCLQDFINYTEQDALRAAEAALKYPYHYPSSLLQDVARSAVTTYYILSLDIDFLPPKDFPDRFLLMTQDLYLPNYKHYVYVLPVLRVPLGGIIPVNINFLRQENGGKLISYFPDKQNFIPDLEHLIRIKWVNTEQMAIIGPVYPKDEWLPWYVSANPFEPLAEEKNGEESKNNRISQVSFNSYKFF